MERRGKSSPAHWRLCGYVNPVRSNIRMGHMRSLARPGDGMRDLPRSLAATQGQDRSPFNTEPGLRSSRFLQKAARLPRRGCLPPACGSRACFAAAQPCPAWRPGCTAAGAVQNHSKKRRPPSRRPSLCCYIQIRSRKYGFTEAYLTVGRTVPPCFKSGGLPPPPGCAFLSGPPDGLSGGGTFPGRRGGRPRCSGRNSSAGRRGGTA